MSHQKLQSLIPKCLGKARGSSNQCTELTVQQAYLLPAVQQTLSQEGNNITKDYTYFSALPLISHL
jgi:hypothetical protein